MISKKIACLEISIGIITNLVFSGTVSAASDEDLAQFLVEKEALESIENYHPDEQIIKKDLIRFTFKSLGYKDSEKNSHPCKEKLSEQEQAMFETAIVLSAIKYKKSDKLCRPEGKVSRIEAISHVLTVYGIPVPKIISNGLELKDVKKDAWFAPLVKKAVDLKLLKPKTKTKFKPFDKMTQREAASLIYESYQFLTKALEPAEEKKEVEEQKPPVVQQIEIVIQPGTEKPQIPHSDILFDVWKQISENYLYYEKNITVAPDEFAYEAIKGLVRSTGDKYADFTTPKEKPILAPVESFGGIGAVLDEIDGSITIVNVLQGNPAEKAGLRSGDIIIKVDGEETGGKSAEEVARLIRGEKTTTVKISVRRNGEIIDFSIVRGRIEVHAITTEEIDQNIALIKIAQFEEKIDEKFNETMKTLIEKKFKGFIIDVRNNPGGYVDSTVKILGRFIPEGKTLIFLDRGKGKISKEVSPGPSDLSAYPLIVLANEGSASASEIFAAAIQEHLAGLVIGTKTFGKGTAQELTKYESGESLKFTVAQWLTPNQKHLDKIGVTPDIEVQNPKGTVTKENDAQLKRAIEEVKKKLGS